MSMTATRPTIVQSNTTEHDWERIEAFLATHVGRYVLPKKLAAAVNANRATVAVPVSDAARLLARMGEKVNAPALALVPPASPAEVVIPAVLLELPASLVELLDWDSAGEAIVSRSTVEALILRGIRVAVEGAAPKPKRATVKKPATIAETVAAAVAGEKKSVSVPTADLARMLAQVEAEQEAEREARKSERHTFVLTGRNVGSYSMAPTETRTVVAASMNDAMAAVRADGFVVLAGRRLVEAEEVAA